MTTFDQVVPAADSQAIDADLAKLANNAAAEPVPAFLDNSPGTSTTPEQVLSDAVPAAQAIVAEAAKPAGEVRMAVDKQADDATLVGLESEITDPSLTPVMAAAPKLEASAQVGAPNIDTTPIWPGTDAVKSPDQSPAQTIKGMIAATPATPTSAPSALPPAPLA